MSKVRGVKIVNRFLDPAVCNALRNIYDQYSGIGTQYDYSRNKVIHLWDLRNNNLRPEFEFMLRVVKRAYAGMTMYMKVKRPVFVEACFIAMLPNGGMHPLHQDNCLPNGAPNHTPQRDISSLVYLNSDFKGGEIVFPGRGILKPHQGQFIMFPSGKEFPHQVNMVTMGRRYSMTVWYSFNKLKDMFP